MGIGSRVFLWAAVGQAVAGLALAVLNLLARPGTTTTRVLVVLGVVLACSGVVQVLAHRRAARSDMPVRSDGSTRPGSPARPGAAGDRPGAGR